MTIHFTPKGVYADTEEDQLTFYDRLHAGDPVILGHILIWRQEQELSEEKENRNDRTGIKREDNRNYLEGNWQLFQG